MTSGKTDWLEQVRTCPPPDVHGWRQCPGLAAREAEELLDWLEAHGHGPRELHFEAGRGFTVRWRQARAAGPHR